MKKQYARISDWKVIDHWFGGRALTGTVVNHPELEPGRKVITSALLSIDKDARLAETENTYYVLEGEEANEGS